MRRLIGISVFITMACGGGEGGQGGEEESAAAAPLGNASISGTVSFVGTPEPNPTIDMSDVPECVAKHEGTPTDPIVVVNDGKLGNVFVRITGGLPEGPYPMPASPAVIDQDGCLYEPRVLGVVVGQELEIKNSDPLMHNIKAVPTENRGFNISQPRVMSTTRRGFNTPEVMIPIECNRHNWMHAYIGVMSHPYFATSGGDGTFTITGLPAGTYQLEAWHEKYGTQRGEVTVEEDGTATVEFTFSAAS